jgi:hypothetical protein
MLPVVSAIVLEALGALAQAVSKAKLRRQVILKTIIGIRSSNAVAWQKLHRGPLPVRHIGAVQQGWRAQTCAEKG